ncbi:MgtC/SapB family protein [Mangrovicella endophytica]|uniref:MgtC/SapB family protein n=1 Tax=Mangrovicella endophytica TaxID=2066697 RepID=UPI000C9EA0F2|nr:MgtC/SapB family protein [Mangrovicella endophytica]
MADVWNWLGDDAAAVQALRLVAALLLTGAVGYEREAGDKVAGLRTHMMVGVGACLFMLLTIRMMSNFDADLIRPDPTRLIEAVTTGVAFLGAGAIVHGRGSVRGLTTGASLWLAGAIGVGCGLGEFTLSVMAVVLTLLVLRGLKLLKRWLF